MSIYEQIVPRVVLEGWPLDMLTNPVERQQGIDLITKECEYVTSHLTDIYLSLDMWTVQFCFIS